MKKGPHAHVLPLPVYLGIFGILLVLTVVTVLVAQVDLGPFALPVAMIVAVIKASLVLGVFMHLAFDNKFFSFIIGSCIIFLSLFIIFPMLDMEGRSMMDDTRSNFRPRNEQVEAIREKDPTAIIMPTKTGPKVKKLEELVDEKPHH